MTRNPFKAVVGFVKGSGGYIPVVVSNEFNSSAQLVVDTLSGKNVLLDKMSLPYTLMAALKRKGIFLIKCDAIPIRRF